MRTLIAMMMLATATHADPLPQPRPLSGSCPSGYYTSGSFCAPSHGAQDAVPTAK
jgi:hypothetical protein